MGQTVDRRISFEEMLHTLLTHRDRIPEPQYLGQEMRLPIVGELAAQLLEAHNWASVDPDRRIVVFADRRPYWGEGEPAMKLYWFFKGIE